MSGSSETPEFRIVMQLRLESDGTPGTLTEILRILSGAGRTIAGHLSYHVNRRRIDLFLCGSIEEGGAALRRGGFDVETETALMVQVTDRPGVLAYLVQTVEAEGIQVDYSYSTLHEGRRCVVLRTNDNPKAEDVLRNYFALDSSPWPGDRVDEILSQHPHPTKFSSTTPKRENSQSSS